MQNRTIWRVVAAAFLALSGCATLNPAGATEISPIELRKLSHTDTTDCLFYRGSDDSFHYISRRQTFEKTVGNYKVRIDELPLQRTFGLGESSCPLFLTTGADGTVEVRQGSPRRGEQE